MLLKKLLIGIGLITVCASVFAEAGKREYKNTFDKEGVTELIISNQYGNIEVSQTYGTEIEVEANLQVAAKTFEKADEFADYISFTELEENGIISIKTEFARDISMSKMFKGIDLQISYLVKVPRGINLRLINTEGNVFMDSFEGELNVDIRNSNFNAQNLIGDFYIKQINGEFSVGEADKVAGEFRNVSLKIENAYMLDLSVYGGNSVIKAADVLKIKSSSGTIRLGEIEKMDGISTGTKYEIADIGDALKMDITRGEMNVRNIHFHFSTLEVKANYAKLGFTFMEGAGYHLELKHNKSTKLDIPANFTLVDKPTSEKSVSIKAGFVGDKKFNSRVNLDMRYGNIFLQ